MGFSKKITYVAASILQNSEDKILLVQRPRKKHMSELWEFPGGKVEKNELPEEALKRELFEELNIHVEITDLKPLSFISYDYQDFHLIMFVFICYKWKGEITLKEDQPDFIWASALELKNYPMPPADLSLLDLIL